MLRAPAEERRFGGADVVAEGVKKGLLDVTGWKRLRVAAAEKRLRVAAEKRLGVVVVEGKSLTLPGVLVGAKILAPGERELGLKVAA